VWPVTSSTDAKRCFVISPIGPENSSTREHADDVFDFIIKPAMDELGVAAVRSDHLHEPGMISEQMLRAILDYELCVAVLTFHNPNVFYELAIAQAARRPVIILIDKGNDLPFDIKDMRCVYYDLKPRALFDHVYSNQIVEHVKSLERGGWVAKGPLDGILPAAGQDLCTVLASASDYGGSPRWLELVKQTEHEFAIAGINLHDWRKTMSFVETVERKLQDGCRVRVLLIDRENPALPGLINDLAPSSSMEEVSAGLSSSESFFRKLADSHENFEMRTIRTGCPHFNLTITDQVAVAIQYLYAARTALSPTLVCPADSPLYATFQREFDSLWNANDPQLGSSPRAEQTTEAQAV